MEMHMFTKTSTTILVFFVLLVHQTTVAQAHKDRSGPVVTAHSDLYQIGDKWYCPLCRKEVPNGDRSRMDPKLCLSEWHDVMIEKKYFDKKIRYITDEELVNSLNIPKFNPMLQKEVQTKNYDKISELLFGYMTQRRDNKRLSLYDPQNKKFFTTIDEFVNDVNADTLRYNRIIRSANSFYTPEKGFTIYSMNWGRKIDFNHTYPEASKWSIHYLGFIDDQINYYLLQHDPQTPKAFEDVFNQWYDQLDDVKNEHVINHTKAYDFIWYELGLANRTQKLIDAYRVFSHAMSAGTNKKLLKIILGSSRWMDECIKKTPFHPYNWQTHTAMTLAYAACVFPEFRESASWFKRSKANMELHLKNDIFDDGGYVERTSSYAEYMYSVYLRYMLMLKYFKNDAAFMNKHIGRIEKYIEFFVLTNSPVGVNPAFNDAHRNKSLVRVFKEMGEFFDRGDFIGAVQNNLSAETLANLKVKPCEPKITSVDFPNSQFVVMRDSWDPRSYYMITNYGGFQNHCHYDQLDFEIYANGIPIAVDAGLGKLGYIDSIHVSWYKNPLAHNMITINQAIPEKLDKSGYDKIWSPQKFTEYFAATHDGFLAYQQTRHRRHIVYSKSRYWLIVDEIFTKEKDKDIDFNLHTPCDMTEIMNGFISDQENGFLIKSDNSDAPNIQKIKSKGWADLGDLDHEPSNREIDWLIFRKESKGEQETDRMATVIFPFESKTKIDPEDISVEKLVMADKRAIGYRVKSAGTEDIIIFSDGTYRKLTDTIEGDFKYGFFSYKNGKLAYSSLSGVKKYKVSGESENSFSKRQDFEVQK
jgi:hypothetical protein